MNTKAIRLIMVAIAFFVSTECYATSFIFEDLKENALSVKVMSPRANSTGFQNIFSVPVHLKKGDIVTVTGQMEVTTELPFDVMFASFLALGKTPYDWKYTFSPRAGTNINRKQHHYTKEISASQKILADYDGYLNFFVYSANMYHKGKIKVEQNYGRMSVIVHRNER